jgi:hypothetical protein
MRVGYLGKESAGISFTEGGLGDCLPASACSGNGVSIQWRGRDLGMIGRSMLDECSTSW